MKYRIAWSLLTVVGTLTCSPAPAEAHTRTVHCQAIGLCPSFTAGQNVGGRRTPLPAYDTPRPPSPPTWKVTTLAPTTGFVVHVVRASDTLWGISLRYYGTGARWAEIAARSGIVDPKRLRAGSTVRVVFP